MIIFSPFRRTKNYYKTRQFVWFLLVVDSIDLEISIVNRYVNKEKKIECFFEILFSGYLFVFFIWFEIFFQRKFFNLSQCLKTNKIDTIVSETKIPKKLRFQSALCLNIFCIHFTQCTIYVSNKDQKKVKKKKFISFGANQKKNKDANEIVEIRLATFKKEHSIFSILI